VKIKAGKTIAKMREVVELKFMVTSLFGFIDKDCGVKEWKVKTAGSKTA
jgi:hypothetical protein